MGNFRISDWRKLPVSLTELCINTTLRCGQSFRWRKLGDEWSCALRGRILILRQDSTYLYYKAYNPTRETLPTPPPSSPSSLVDECSGAGDDTEALIVDYFNLTPNLTQLYTQWSAADANFRKKAPKFAGVRILRQDAWEALAGFICSSNNNIIRISQMVHNLCKHYGPLVGYCGGVPYHDFPPPTALTGSGVEQHLRELGFGYRAKYLYRTACMIANERQEGWLEGLRNPESPLTGIEPRIAREMLEAGREGYRTAHSALLDLQGVGAKVADCVCLMGLGWGEAVPVDTHVWQIAQRDYNFGKGKHSSLTKATYDAVGNRFRSLWGQEAGWAHSVLFTADLRAFSERLVVKTEKKKKKLVAEIKTEDGQPRQVVAVMERKVKLEKKVKREFCEEAVMTSEVDEDMMSSIKRRRRGKT